MLERLRKIIIDYVDHYSLAQNTKTHWRKPLIARNLDIIKDFSDIFSSDFSYFYNEVNIPLSTTLRKQLIQEYDRKISGLEKFLDKNIISNLENQVKQIFKEDSIDFLYLSPVMQKQFLEKIKDKDLLEETRKMNTLLLKQMEKMLTANTINFEESDIEKFNLNNHAEQIGNIISSLKYDILKIPSPKKNINYSLMASFINSASISLLYDPV